MKSSFFPDHLPRLAVEKRLCRLLLRLSPLLLLLTVAHAGVPVNYSQIERSGGRLPADLARGVEEAFSVGQESWINFRHLLVVSPEAFPLHSSLGLHHGWPYQQQLAFGALRPLGAQKPDPLRKGQTVVDPNAWRYGFLWSYQRRGWAQEDFYFIPPDGEFAAGWSSHLVGALLDRPLWGLQMGAGVVGRNRTDWPKGVAKEVQQPWMGWGRLGIGALQGWILVGRKIEGWSLALDLEKRSVENGPPTGWKGYMPRIRFESEGANDSLHFEWEQPLWNHQLYLKSRWSLDSGLEWGEIAFYPDASRFFAVAGTWKIREGSPFKEGMWGGLIRLGIAEFGYSYAPEMESMIGMEQTLFVRLGFAISRLKQDLDAAPSAGGFSSGLTKKETR